MATIEQDARERAVAAGAEEWVRRRGATREREFKLGNALMDEAERLMALPIGSSKWSRATIARLALTGSRLARLAAEMGTGEAPDEPAEEELPEAVAGRVLDALAAPGEAEGGGPDADRRPTG